MRLKHLHKYQISAKFVQKPHRAFSYGMKFMLAKKVNMTQIFGEDGRVKAATVLSAGPLKVTEIKTSERDGYTAIQTGFGTRASKNVSKPVRGQLGDLGTFEYLKEFRVADGSSFKKGDEITLESFKVGDKVNVRSISKAKGFQGVVKRHGFHGGPRSHGQKHSEREPGSISGGTRNGGRVPKGMRMAGRMGGENVTVKNLIVLAIDPATNTMLVSGAVPGRRGTLVEIR